MKKSMCAVCGNEEAVFVMYPKVVTDEQRANGGNVPVLMCRDCARDAFEQGEYEADGMIDEQ